MKKLETLLNDIDFDSLPPAWTSFDLARFSGSISLFDYQQRALQNALKALWKYYSEQQPAERKRAFYEWYLDNQIEIPDLPLGKKRDNTALLTAYYPVVDSGIRKDARIPYENLANRMGFWLATGSGKTLVIVKLIEVLWTLMGRNEIPNQDVLVLTHREDLLKQLRDHVAAYNAAGNPLYIRLKELKEYAEVKRSSPSLLGQHEITVFTYRSDNLSDEQKERIIDFRNYDNHGRWYVLLDEAHKGDKEDSKRQHIYSILSREGFLFNFSATFTDPRDILTTAAEFNLASFIEAGYGKHITILKQENTAFRRDNGDFTDEEKQKIVLQSLLMLAYIHKARAGLQEAAGETLYHRPMLLVLVNSVNTDDADLKLFFAQLERIARGELSSDAFQRARSDLWRDLNAEPEWLYENARFHPDHSLFNSLTLKDVLKTVFNTEQHGAIEVIARPSNDKELAFKLRTTSAPFALIRIGNTAEWLKNFLVGYEIVKGFGDESFFERLNADDSDITMLMGSRSFYEGWDSNRPNVITFINIGTGVDARKFILQSVGRGVRLEPIKGKRKRLASLDTAREIDHLTFTLARPFLPAIETLFIFGTNRAALESVFKELDQEKEKEEGIELALEVNSAVAERTLLIPTYRYANLPLIEQRAPRKFELPQPELEYLKGYLDYLGDERLLLAHHDLSPQQIGYLDKTLDEPETYFNTAGGRRFGSVNILLPRLARYFDLLPKQLEGFKPLENEINHYQHIRVLLKDIEELRRKIKAVQEYKDPAKEKAALKEQLRLELMDIDAYTNAIEELARTSAEELFTPPQGAPLRIKNIASHYYVPLLLSEEERIDYIRHIIHVPSEVRFITQLETYLRGEPNAFNAFDWWMFSRADESLDKVIIPYYDPSANKMRDFHPDFVFWLKRWNDYFILFVDPKGMRNAGYQYKIDGYKEIFTDRETGELRVFRHNGLNVRVALAMHTTDANQAPLEYKEYWFDHPKDILKRLVAS